MNSLFNIGDKLYGFCDGYFGRDDYDTKICVLITPKYAVFQYLEGDFKGNATVLNNPEKLDKKTVNAWKIQTKHKITIFFN
jgi:hypothetical protein